MGPRYHPSSPTRNDRRSFPSGLLYDSVTVSPASPCCSDRIETIRRAAPGRVRDTSAIGSHPPPTLWRRSSLLLPLYAEFVPGIITVATGTVNGQHALGSVPLQGRFAACGVALLCVRIPAQPPCLQTRPTATVRCPSSASHWRNQHIARRLQPLYLSEELFHIAQPVTPSTRGISVFTTAQMTQVW